MLTNKKDGSKHTPGPWKSRAGEVYALGGSTPIAHVWLRGASAERIANARLIAAAPEMLEAIQTAYDMLNTPSDHMSSEEWADRASGVLRALLARLEGGK